MIARDFHAACVRDSATYVMYLAHKLRQAETVAAPRLQALMHADDAHILYGTLLGTLSLSATPVSTFEQGVSELSAQCLIHASRFMDPRSMHASWMWPVHLQGPSLQMIRRHARSSEQMHYGPALQTVSGNWVAGKRKGVIGGVDFGSTGNVGSSLSLLLGLPSKRKGMLYHGQTVWVLSFVSVCSLQPAEPGCA